ncbi:putative Cyclin-dependent kinase 3 [Blattamonas nauphoetae]|uniref:Cyclin-dependent kinase 3 n=1 Tax=Blattamonas nauphoetae TaxID=2049346 RepID=A0ABQ9X9K0_9EUKA|nr:putative Cyclin-dependent kinase 3 [Blattamonas nauphoetae]
MNKYENIKRIGEGSFSKVYLSRNLESGEQVCIKRHIQKVDPEDDHHMDCELSAVSVLQNDNILRFREDFHDSKGRHCMVYDLMETDLRNIISGFDGIFPLEIRKEYLREMLSAVSACHLKQIAHMDITPENFLVSRRRSLHLSDFGLSVSFQPPPDRFLCMNRTSWYTSPERLFGRREWLSAGDMWGVGCIYLELLQETRPIFPGTSSLGQIRVIGEILGQPSPELMEKFSTYPGFIPFPDSSGNIDNILSHIDDNERDLVLKLLEYDPDKRISASEALLHPFFTAPPLPSPLDLLPDPALYPKLLKKRAKTHNIRPDVETDDIEISPVKYLDLNAEDDDDLLYT